jgi:hypothetical protein
MKDKTTYKVELSARIKKKKRLDLLAWSASKPIVHGGKLNACRPSALA